MKIIVKRKGAAAGIRGRPIHLVASPVSILLDRQLMKPVPDIFSNDQEAWRRGLIGGPPGFKFCGIRYGRGLVTCHIGDEQNSRIGKLAGRETGRIIKTTHVGVDKVVPGVSIPILGELGLGKPEKVGCEGDEGWWKSLVVNEVSSDPPSDLLKRIEFGLPMMSFNGWYHSWKPNRESNRQDGQDSYQGDKRQSLLIENRIC